MAICSLIACRPSDEPNAVRAVSSRDCRSKRLPVGYREQGKLGRIMLRRLLSLTLVAALLQCPFSCGLVVRVRANEGEANIRCSCCHHGKNKFPARHNSAPTNHIPDKHCCGQCICNGAVIEHAANQSPSIDLDCWGPVPATASVTAVSRAVLSFEQSAHQAGDGMNPGRAMRCLFVSYLC